MSGVHFVEAAGRVTVGLKEAERLTRGHPWVRRDRTQGGLSGLRDGDVVDVVDAQGRFLGRGLTDARSATAVRIFTTDPAETLNAALLARRFAAARERRLGLETSGRDDAYRLANAEGDGLPGLIAERYGPWIVLLLETPAWEAHREAVVRALRQAAPPAGIIAKRWYEAGTEGDATANALWWGKAPPEEIEAREGGLRFLVRLGEGVKTGLFLDQRRNRRTLAPLWKGRSFLNLFCYSGAFSVAARRAGASRAVSCDLSAAALAWTRRNLELNGFAVAADDLLEGDARIVLRRMAQEGKTFGGALFDPPTFARGKRGGTFALACDLPGLAEAAARVVEPGGWLAASVHAERLAPARAEEALRAGVAAAGRGVRGVRKGGLPTDFPLHPGLPAMNYLRFWTLLLD